MTTGDWDEAPEEDEPPPARDALAALRGLAEPGRHEPGLLAGMSHVGRAEVGAWHAAWAELDAERRRGVARAMLEGAEADVQLDFGTLFRLLLDDEDAEVRAVAVDGLWESNDPRLARRFVELLQADGHAEVRARAAEALGNFVELGELGRLDEDLVGAALAALLKAAGDRAENLEVRRRAIAAAGFADTDEVRALLAEGLDAAEAPIRLGAMRGIGNSADDAWEAEVLRGLGDGDAELRFEAVRAAGELELAAAVDALARLIQNDEAEIRQEAIWALGEIGGDDAQAVLERLLRRPRDDDEREAIEDALSVGALHRGELVPVPRGLLGRRDDDEDEDDWDLDDVGEDDRDDDEAEDDLDALDELGDWRGAVEDAIDDEPR